MYPMTANFPSYILPRYHRHTELLVDWYLHGNNQTRVNQILQRFQIPNLRRVVRQIVRKWQSCKVLKASPVTHPAPLLSSRLEQCGWPFSYVSLDYFGVIAVKRGRSLVKRWTALFTCLSVRAIHIEVVHVTFKVISRYVHWCQYGMVLQPPNTSVSAKVALESLTSLNNWDNEALLTVIAEKGTIVNYRPLTFMPLQSMEQEALTPNHVIQLSSDGVVRSKKKMVI